LYYLLISLAQIVIFICTRFTLMGKENVPVKGAIVVVANHLSSADPVFLGTKLDRRIIFMAKEELFSNRFSSYFVRQFEAFPVYRRGPDRHALHQANWILGKGRVLGMFPEGKRSAGEMNAAFQGSALIAYHNKVPILPVGITGSEKIRGFSWIWHRPKIALNIGRPFTLPDSGHSLSRRKLNELTEVIMGHISELLPEAYRGAYLDRRLD
jgi:1-acyl-sn-glycerol-3-phosphate acyltransferase